MAFAVASRREACKDLLGRFAFCASFLSMMLCFDGGTSCKSFILKFVAMFTNLTTLGQASAVRRSTENRLAKRRFAERWSASEFAVGMVLSLRKGKGSPWRALGVSAAKWAGENFFLSPYYQRVLGSKRSGETS